MFRLLAVIVVLVTSWAAALADARRDCEKLSGEAAIKACDQAIQQNPSDKVSYLNRGVGHQRNDDLDRALADYTKAIEIDPQFAPAYTNRGVVYEMKGDLDRALADHTKAIEIDPTNDVSWRHLALARYRGGDFKGAAADLLRSLELEDDVYAMLLRYLARARSGETAEAELEANAGRLKDKAWPYAVIELYLGKRSPAATIDAAAKSDDRCEAQFYVGEWHLLKGNKTEAAAALRIAVDTCPKTFTEYTTAVFELKRLQP